MYITELHSLAPLPPKIRYFFPVNYGWEALKVVFRLVVVLWAQVKLVRKCTVYFDPFVAWYNIPQMELLCQKKISDTMEYFFVFFCTCRRMERLLEYSINAYKLFFLGQFLWYFSCVFCRYDQYFRRNWTIGREFWSVLLQMERQMFEYSQLSRVC